MWYHGKVGGILKCWDTILKFTSASSPAISCLFETHTLTLITWGEIAFKHEIKEINKSVTTFKQFQLALVSFKF